MNHAPQTLEEKRQRIMREQGVDWHAATRILARRSAEARKYRASARRRAEGRPVRVVPYGGPGVVVVSRGVTAAGASGEEVSS